jgi:hypothetical protein
LILKHKIYMLCDNEHWLLVLIESMMIRKGWSIFCKPKKTPQTVLNLAQAIEY